MERRLTAKEAAQLRAHDDYLSAVTFMAERQRQMAPQARRGDPFARGYLTALHEFSLAVQSALARRIG